MLAAWFQAVSDLASQAGIGGGKQTILCTTSIYSCRPIRTLAKTPPWSALLCQKQREIRKPELAGSRYVAVQLQLA